MSFKSNFTRTTWTNCTAVHKKTTLGQRNVYLALNLGCFWAGKENKKYRTWEIISTVLSTAAHTAFATTNPNFRPITCNGQGKATLFANRCRSSSTSGSGITRSDVLSSMRLVSITQLNLPSHIVGYSVDKT